MACYKVVTEHTLNNVLNVCYMYEQLKFAGEVKRHNGFLDTGVKQTGSSPFATCYFNGISKIELLLNINLKKLCRNCQ